MENEPMYILLADDDEADRLIFTDAFSELEINTVVQTVDNGTRLMELLHAENTPMPQLLFLDLNMPRKSGLQCLQEIRSDAKLKNIIIAIYSTSGNEKDMDETFLNGANIYITKPNDFHELKKILGKAVETAKLYQDDSLKNENFFLKM